MVSSNSQFQPFQIQAGVQPYIDQTPYSSQYYTFSDKVRFRNGQPEKNAGWVLQDLDLMAQIQGVVRQIWSATINQQLYTLIGTSSRLYAMVGTALFNITPFSTTSVAAANSLSTQYGTLTNPIVTTSGSNSVRVNDPDASRFQPGDRVTFAGASAVGGVTTLQLNAAHVIRSVGSGFYTFQNATVATSSVTGGGAVTRSSGLIRITAANTLGSGDRVSIQNVDAQQATSATINAAGMNAVLGDVLTVQGGTYTTPAQFSISSSKVATETIQAVQSGTGAYAPADVLTVTGGTFSTAATITVNSTQVVQVTLNTAGTGGTNGTQTITGTTGTGTRFQATVTIAGGAITAITGITIAGKYTTNPTLTGEPVTGGGLTGAKVNLVTGVLASSLTNPGVYTVLPVNPVSTTDSGAGTGATFNLTYAINGVSLVTAGVYSLPPTNPVATTSTGVGSGTQLNVTYSAAGNVGGISSTLINSEFIIRDPTATYFYVMTSGVATSAVTSSGGSFTVFFPPIPAGYTDESFGQGYGAGRYGVGLYGTALVSSAGKRYPRIWFFDRYGDLMLMTPGNGTGLYQWSGDTTVAPILVKNAPTAINYFFVDNNIIVTFGNGGMENRITTSDINGIYVWQNSATAQNQVYDDNIEGADRLLCHLNVQGVNLIFTSTKVYVFQYVGLPDVWKIQQLTNSDGIISPNSGVTAEGVAYWQGNENFYEWSGGNVQIIKAPTQNRSTIINYVFDNLNSAQNFKCFAWHDPQYEEVRFHYPSAASNESDRIACYNKNDGLWWPDTISRTAAEKPQIGAFYPKMTDPASNLYNHNYGYDADTLPLSWTLTTNLVSFSKNEALISAFIPDNEMNGTMTVTLTGQQWPSGPAIRSSETFVVDGSNQNRVPTRIVGRYRQYTISGSSLGQFWRMGQWAEEIQQAGNAS